MLHTAYLQLVCAQSVFVVAVVCVKWPPLVRWDLMSPVKHLAGYELGGSGQGEEGEQSGR